MAKKTPSVALPPVDYRLVPLRPEAHLFQVTCTVTDPDPAGQRFALPTWIPGSYMIREFAKNIVRIEASAGGKAVGLTQIDKATWQADKVPAGTALSVTMEVYAWDLSVRGAHLDASHGFFNGTSVFLCALGQEDRPCRVELVKPQGKAYAALARGESLPVAKGEKGEMRGAAALYGFGRYRAADYDELIDHPVEMGKFALGHFEAAGVPHELAITGRVPNLDMARLEADLARVCAAQIRMFEPRAGKAPFERFLFLITALGDGYGGLEHRDSTALICKRDDLPAVGEPAGKVSEGYGNFLGLASHEYFHSWNVKRMKPAAFTPYDLNREGHTTLLWAFEGITSYYDDLALVRSGLIDEKRYLGLLAKTITGVLRGNGRTKQTLADSSFDAWTKYYRQDENSPNSIVSYYTKGSLVALGLDLQIRAETQGKKSLDDVMRALWKSFGKDFYAETNGASKAPRGLDENGFVAAVMASTGVDVSKFVKRYVDGVEDVPLADLYRDFGVNLEASEASKKAALMCASARVQAIARSPPCMNTVLRIGLVCLPAM